MQTAKELHCPACGEDKEHDDFYWQKHTWTSTQIKREPECKKCISDRNKKNREEKRREQLWTGM